MYQGIFKHLILFKSELNHSKGKCSALLTLIEWLLMFYLKQRFVKNSTGNKMTDCWTSWLKGLKMVVLLLLSLNSLNRNKYDKFIDLQCTRPFGHKIYIQSFGLYLVCEWLGRVDTSINSYKYVFNPIKNTPAILLITAKLAICSAIPLREPITFELDDKIPALYQINKFSQRVDKSLHSNTLALFRANQYLILLITAACLAMKQKCEFDVFHLLL